MQLKLTLLGLNKELEEEFNAHDETLLSPNAAQMLDDWKIPVGGYLMFSEADHPGAAAEQDCAVVYIPFRDAQMVRRLVSPCFKVATLMLYTQTWLTCLRLL